MSPTASSARTCVVLAASLLLPAAFLGACSAAAGDGCSDTAAELKQLATQPLLGTAPADATAPADYRGVNVTTGCDDDSSGKPWLHADRLYAFPGKPGDVIAHYAEAATATGWHRESDPTPGAPPAAVEGACWTRTAQGRHLLFSVDFRTGGFSPEPEAGAGIAYEVSLGTRSDGGTATCWR